MVTRDNWELDNASRMTYQTAGGGCVRLVKSDLQDGYVAYFDGRSIRFDSSLTWVQAQDAAEAFAAEVAAVSREQLAAQITFEDLLCRTSGA